MTINERLAKALALHESATTLGEFLTNALTEPEFCYHLSDELSGVDSLLSSYIRFVYEAMIIKERIPNAAGLAAIEIERDFRNKQREADRLERQLQGHWQHSALFYGNIPGNRIQDMTDESLKQPERMICFNLNNKYYVLYKHQMWQMTTGSIPSFIYRPTGSNQIKRVDAFALPVDVARFFGFMLARLMSDKS